MLFDAFKGELVVVSDVAGHDFEGIWAEVEAGPLPQVLVKNCRQINWQDATVFPLKVEWWHVGDKVFHLHHIIGVHKTNLQPRG